LIHGSFAPTEYAAQFGGREVLGRKLFVEVQGKVVTWETVGFTDTTRMPALPSELRQVADFLGHERVKQILGKWRIGWAPKAAIRPRSLTAALFGDEIATGTDPVDISGALVAGSVRGFPINTCLGTITPTEGFIITSSIADEKIVAQCCPQSLPVFGVKACPVTTNISSCGVAAAACKACPGYPKPYAPSCQLRIGGGGPDYYIEHCSAAQDTPPTLSINPPVEIWPPNNKMLSYKLGDLVTAVSACGNALDVNADATITSITSNETAANDSQIVGNSDFMVRARRDGSGGGRTYQVHFTVNDSLWGGQSSGVVEIVVPRDRN
jgi:hypothetical protein